jgi:asparaginyl-tRNA synthetase
MVEPEVAFTTLEELMELAEDLVCYIVERVLERRRTELAILERDPTPLERVAKSFPRMTYDEAVQWLLDHGLPMTPGDDFGSPQETALSQAFDRPLIVHRYPAAVKAFYMEPDPERPDRVLCMDVLAPEGVGEIIGGSMRVWNYDLLLRRLRDHNLPEAAFRWYLDLRRYGSVPHGGFGLGLERTVAWICGLEHVREAIPFPRTIYRLYP